MTGDNITLSGVIGGAGEDLDEYTYDSNFSNTTFVPTHRPTHKPTQEEHSNNYCGFDSDWCYTLTGLGVVLSLLALGCCVSCYCGTKVQRAINNEYGALN